MEGNLNLISVIIVAVGLSMDSLAVSFSCSIASRKLKLIHIFKIAIYFGTSQALILLIGWLVGFSLKEYVTSFAYWVAFVLLILIGGKMIYSSFKSHQSNKLSMITTWELLYLSIATSIDALVVGISFAFLDGSIMYPVVITGIVTFTLSVIGGFLGKTLSNMFGNKVEFMGGLILIAIGTKILIEHLSS